MAKYIFILFIVLFVHLANAQQNHEHEHEHKHHHTHEVGVSVAPVYFTNEAAFSIATHLHYVYNFPHTKFGVGVGYERIFDEHKHNFIGVELNYRPVHRLTLNISPGLAFEGEHKNEKDFALHFETVYEFEFGAFHIGPVLELAYHPEDYHISLGIHIGLAL
jgi:hypothetical protein